MPANQIENEWISEKLYKEPCTDNRLAVVVGSGPSLRGFNFSALADCRTYTIAINDEIERNREAYTPNAWIMYDTGVMLRHAETVVSPKTDIFIKPQLVEQSKQHHTMMNKPRPEWIDRALLFDGARSFQLGKQRVYMARTTATAALHLAVNMGFARILLLGIDLCTPVDHYYYTGDKKPRRTTPGNKQWIDDDLFMEPRHRKMMFDFGQIHKGLRHVGWKGEIFQGSPRSPLELWPKKSIGEILG